MGAVDFAFWASGIDSAPTAMRLWEMVVSASPPLVFPSNRRDGPMECWALAELEAVLLPVLLALLPSSLLPTAQDGWIPVFKAKTTRWPVSTVRATTLKSAPF